MSKESNDLLAEMRADFAEKISKEKNKQKRKKLEQTANYVLKCIEENKPLNFRAEVAIEIIFDGRLAHIQILNSDCISLKTRDNQATGMWRKTRPQKLK